MTAAVPGAQVFVYGCWANRDKAVHKEQNHDGVRSEPHYPPLVDCERKSLDPLLAEEVLKENLGTCPGLLEGNRP